MQREFKVAIFGASPDTPNMGVSALFVSLVHELYTAFSGHISFVVFDFQRGYRKSEMLINDKRISCEFFGARGGRKYHLPENLYSIHFLSKFGRFGKQLNPALKLLDGCDAVIDVSGGDSFSDIYGIRRFTAILLPKLIATNLGKPLILAPQTYGPFKEQTVLRSATAAIKASSMVWARDEESFGIIKNLLADAFNPDMHLCGVDMAFKLPLQPALNKLDQTTARWITESKQEPVIGFNISGLIYHDPEAAKSHYGFIIDYNQTVLQFIKKVLAETDCRVLLIPHVMDVGGHYESDALACQQLISQLDARYHDRVAVTPTHLNQSEVKWIISNMHWFCGTRMHATIAALSTATPAASISYSDKTRGVFATCGQEQHVFDPRVLDADFIVSGLFESLQSRAQTKSSLESQLVPVMNQADLQMQTIANYIRAL